MLVVMIIAVALLFYFIVIYNKLVKGKIHVREGWSGIDVQLKRRTDLIPNIVEVVKGYMQHERGVLERVTELRSKVSQTSAVGERAVLENGITQALKSIFAVVEAYPDLKANQNVADLHKNLVTIEDEIQMSRRYYNGTVRNFNILVESFPSNVIAGAFKFTIAEFFELESSAEGAVPEVKL